MKRGVHITGTITVETTQHHPKHLHVVTTLVNEKNMGFDCPILDISDSKMGKVGLVILVDMSTNMVPKCVNNTVDFFCSTFQLQALPCKIHWPSSLLRDQTAYAYVCLPN